MIVRCSQPPLSLSIACAGLFVIFMATGCSRSDTASAIAKAVPVSVLQVKFEPVPLSLEAVGQAEGAREVEVRARVGGILTKRLFDEGTAVKAGQPLFQIDKVPYEIALAQARSQLAEQKARATQTAREAARLKGLLDQRAISQKEFDDSTSNNAAAEASMQAAEALIRQAELNLSYATVTAPVSGISGRAERSEGTLISTGADSLLTTIVQANPVWVRFGVSDNELAALRGTGNKRRTITKVEALLPDGSVYAQPGRINFESVAMDRQLGTMTLRAEFDNRDGSLIPGQFVRVRLQSGGRSAVLVPQTALLQTDRGSSVFVLATDSTGKSTAQPRPVKTEGWSGSNWVVSSGLNPGDKIIVDNLLKLKPGMPVKVDLSEPAPTTPATNS